MAAETTSVHSNLDRDGTATDSGAFTAIRGVGAPATCLFAAALWAGCAGVVLTGHTAVECASSAAELVEPCLTLAALCAAACVACAAVRGRARAPEAKWTAAMATLLCASAVLLGGGLRLAQSVEAAERPVLAPSDDRQLARIEATLVDPFVERSGSTDLLARHLVRPPRFHAVVEDIVFLDERGTRIQPLDPTSRLTVSAPERPTDLKIGQRLSLIGWVRGPPTPTLPGSERIGDHLALHGIAGGITLESAGTIMPIDAAHDGESLRWTALRLRAVMREALRTGLLAGVPNDEESGGWAVRAMLVALILGDVEVGYRAIDDSFRAVGLSHILAISGFNLAVLGWVAATTARLVSRDERVHAAAVGLAALLALCLMAPAASAVRSALMSIVGACGASIGRQWNGDAILALAAVAMLVITPSDAMNAGFQLSFGCVLALRHLSPMVAARWLHWIPADDASRMLPVWIGIGGTLLSRALAAGIAAFLASVPIVLCHFGTFQPFGVLLTLLCSPLATVTLVVAYPKAVVGAMLAAWIPDATAPLGPALWLPAWMQIALVDRAILMGAGSAAPGAIHWFAALLALAAIVGALRAPRRRGRLVCALCAGVLLVATPGRTASQPDVAIRETSAADLRVTMFAVGDGSAYAVESAGSLAFFDAGSSSHGSIGARALLPWVLQRGGRVDAIVVSHPDIDHFSAVADLVRHASVDVMHVHDSVVELATVNAAAAELLATAAAHGTRLSIIAAGDSFIVGASRWTVLWPDAGWRSRRDNDLSLVIRVETAPDLGGCRACVLLTGDIETEPAARLTAGVRNGSVDLRCDMMELPHHGSWREAIVPFIEAAEPAIILQSTAARRWRTDRFAPHLAGRHRLVTCRDGTVQALVRRDGEVLLFAWDPRARGGWRPVGGIASRDRRPRPVARPRRLTIRRGPVVLCRGRSARSQEHRAPKNDPVARNSVASVSERDLEPWGGRRSGGEAADSKRKNAASEARAKSDPLDVAVAKPRNDLDGRIGGSGLGDRDFRGEDERRVRSDKGGGQLEVHSDAAIESDLAEPEKALPRVLDPHRLLELVSIALGRRLDRSDRTGCKRVDRLWIEDERDGRGRERARAIRLGGVREKGVRESEHPASLPVELHSACPDVRPVGKPHGDPGRGGRADLRECDRSDAFRRDLAWCATIVERWSRALGTAIVGLRRILGRARRFDLRWLKRLEQKLASDRIDEARDGVAVDEQHGVCIGTRGGTGLRAEPDLRKAIEIDGNRADPAVQPHRTRPFETEVSGQQLPVVKYESAGVELGEERHITRQRVADQASHDEVPRDSLVPIGRPEGERRIVERGKLPRAPRTVPMQDMHGDKAISRDVARGGGLRRVRRRSAHLGGRSMQQEERRGRDAGGAAGRRGGADVPAEGCRTTSVGRARKAKECGRRVGVHGRKEKPCVSALEDGEIALGHLENDQSHSGPVGVALRICPRTIGSLLGEKFIANRRPPGLPSVAACEIHGLHRVVVPVEVVRLGESPGDPARLSAWKGMLAEIVEPTLDRLVLVDTCVEEARDSRSCSRPRRPSEVLHIPEAAVCVLARSDIPRRIVDRRLRDLDASVPRTPQRHDLTDRDGDVRIIGNGVVAPAAFVVLARHDQLHSTHKRVSDPVVVPVHPVDLSEEERGEAVPVHRTMGLVRNEKPRLRRMRQDEVERLLDLLGEVASTRDIAVSHEGDRAEACDPDMLAKSTLAKRAIGLLLAPQVLEALAHRLLELRRDLVVGRCILSPSGLNLASVGAPNGCHWVRGHWRRSNRRGSVLDAEACDAKGRGFRGVGNSDTERVDRRPGVRRRSVADQATGPLRTIRGAPHAHRRARLWRGSVEIQLRIHRESEVDKRKTASHGSSDGALLARCRSICAIDRTELSVCFDRAARRQVAAERRPLARARGPPDGIGRGGRGRCGHRFQRKAWEAEDQ